VPSSGVQLPLPRCALCGAVLKPGVVMFGELLPHDALARAVELAAGAGLLLVVGSSLQVWPVAGLPDETLRRGGRVAVVNREPTPYDHRAELVIHGDAGVAFARLRPVLLGERADGVDVHRQPDAGVEGLEEL
jgi:NAD-dependent deacetylase